MAERLYIHVRIVGDLAIVGFNQKGLIGASLVEGLGSELHSLIDHEGWKHILLNFSGVETAASAALAQLIRLDRKVKEVRGILRLCSLTPSLLEVFRASRLDRVFDIRSGSSGDDDLEIWGAWVPKPSPPDDLQGHASAE